jgi:hypothetical protein
MICRISLWAGPADGTLLELLDGASWGHEFDVPDPTWRPPQSTTTYAVWCMPFGATPNMRPMLRYKITSLSASSDGTMLATATWVPN